MFKSQTETNIQPEDMKSLRKMTLNKWVIPSPNADNPWRHTHPNESFQRDLDKLVDADRDFRQKWQHSFTDGRS